jgi:hypothetical protein
MQRNIFAWRGIVAVAVLLVAIAPLSVHADYKYDYHDYDEIITVLEGLETEASSKNPNVYSLQIIGYSHQGNPIYAVKFSDNPATEEDSEPDVIVDSGMHANEWLPVESNINFIQYLFDAYYDNVHPDHTEVLHLVHNFEIWIIPVVNPDGRIRDDLNGGDPESFWTDTSYHNGDDQGWRMNVQEVDCAAKPGKVNIGIDINRSWSRRFWEDSDCGGNYAGAYPFQPTESKVLKQFIHNHMISLIFHQHSALNIIISNSQTTGLGTYLTAEMDSVYEEDGLPDPMLEIQTELEMMDGSPVGGATVLKAEQDITIKVNDYGICNGMRMTGQYYNWLWYEIDCILSPDNLSRRAIQSVFYEYPVKEENYGHPNEGKIGRYQQEDGSNYFHPSSGEIIEWIISRSREINKYIIKQSRYPFSPRNHTDMSRRPEAPTRDLAIVGAKISEAGDGLAGCFTYDENDGQDLLAAGLKRITWNIQNNGASERAINTDITICNLTDDPNCSSPATMILTRNNIVPEAIETFTYNYFFESVKDYAVTLSTGESNDYDNDVKRYIFTTTDTGLTTCPVVVLVGDEADQVLHLVRMFRDEIMYLTPKGRAYIQLFYRHADELTALISNDIELLNQSQKFLSNILPLLASLIKGEAVTVSQKLLNDMGGLWDTMSKQASPTLRETFENLKKDLKTGEILRCLGSVE